MKTILFGNGLNIQYGGFDHLNKNIVKRAMRKITSGDYPKEIYPEEILMHIKAMTSIVKDVVDGKYDQFALTKSEKSELEIFKNRYAKKARKIKAYDIGFEDFFLLNLLLCRRTEVSMEILRDSKDAIRSIYLDTIYDNGTVNLIYKNFPDKFIVWLKGFDEIQTTNYDSNLELATSREVMHVHGAFSDMKDIYRSDSLRNMLSDRPIDNVKIFYEYAHLYSTALTAYSGDTKDFMAKQAQNSNEALVKLVDAYNNNPEVKADVDSWKNDNNEAVRKLYESLMIKIENPDIEYRDIIPIERLDEINGDLYIVGLAPTNDTHILYRISENDKLEKIIYYYFLENDKDLFSSSMSGRNIEFRDVGEFWKSFEV